MAAEPCARPCFHPRCSAIRMAASQPERQAPALIERLTERLANPGTLAHEAKEQPTHAPTHAKARAEQQRRWRKAHPEKHRAQQRASRARKKAAA